MSKKPALGKGLGALIPMDEGVGDGEAGTPTFCPIEKIRPNPHQPRKRFDEEALAALAGTIREKGVLQPLLVRRMGDGYELIAGERRLRAAKMAGLKEVPIVLREAEPSDSLELSVLENIQRENLNPVEEAKAYREMMERLQLTQEELARRVGKDRSSVANTMRLLQLPEEIQEDLATGKISAGHARALLAVEHEVLQLKILALIKEKGLSVRATEEVVHRFKEGRRKRSRHAALPDPDMQALEDELCRRFETRVKIQAGKKGGKIQISYSSMQDLDRICNLLIH